MGNDTSVVLLALRKPLGTWRTPLSLLALLAICFFAFGAPRAQYRKHGAVLLPDLDITPGKVRTSDLKIVCGTTTRQFRKTTEAMKKAACLLYGVMDCPKEGVMELDHLVPLELGGADDISNLWPQPAEPTPGFHEKDKLENELHRHVCPPSPKCPECIGDMGLEGAQAKIAKDWYGFYLELFDFPKGTSGAR